MGICSSKSSASPADKKASKLPPPPATAAAGAKKAPVPAPAKAPAKAPADGQHMQFVPATDNKVATQVSAERPPVELSVAPPKAAVQTAADRATSTARVEEVVEPRSQPTLPDDGDGGAIIRRAPPPPPQVFADDKPAETAQARKEEWETVRARLPRQKTPEDKQRRIDLFARFDKDKSGALTFEEVHKGCIDILHLDHFTPHLHDITKRAFNKAKGLGTEDRGTGEDDKVEFLEFRLMLCYIYDYFELTVMFDEIDKDGSMMIDEDEFVSKAAPMLQKWGVPVADPAAAFKEIDSNESGIVTFEEFATWATEKKVESEGDPDAGVADAAVATDRSLPAPQLVEAAAAAPESHAEEAPAAAEPPKAETEPTPVVVPEPVEATAPAAAAVPRAAPVDTPLRESVELNEPSASARKTEWERIQALLPRQKTPEDKQRRIDLFESFDKDKSGALTFEEVYKGCVNILHLNRFTGRLRDITKRAFNKAKGLGTEDRGTGEDDKVEFLEFRLMLCYIYDYFELTVMFDEIDKDGSMMIDKKEFVSKAAPMLQKWGVPVTDPAAVFSEIDDNNSQHITFDEFATWATEKKVESEGDPDAPAAEQDAEQDAEPIVFTDDSELAGDGDKAAQDVAEAETDEDAGPVGDLDPRRVYGFDGDSTGLGAGAKEEGAMALDDVDTDDDDDGEVAPPADDADADQVQAIASTSDNDEGEKSVPPPPPPAAPVHVDPMADVAPMVPVVVRATKDHEYEMGEAEAEGDGEVKEASAPRALSLEAAEKPTEAAEATAKPDAIQQTIIDDLFADDAAAPASAPVDPPAPRRLPPPMPSPAEGGEEVVAVEDEAKLPQADAAEKTAAVDATTPPPARRAPPPMFSPPPPDADSDAENSVSKGVESFYGRGAADEAAPSSENKKDQAAVDDSEDEL